MQLRLMRQRDRQRDKQQQQLDDSASNSEPANPGANSPCPSEGKGRPLKWLALARPEDRPSSGRVGCSCRRRWLWLTLLGRARRRLLKIESEACETFRAGLYLYTGQPLAYHFCLILAQGEGGVH